MRRYLVVANQTLGGDELVRLIGERAAAEPSEFFLVVPATPILEMVQGASGMLLMGGFPALPASFEDAHEVAKERLRTALEQLKDVKAEITGRVADQNPIRAVEAALAERTFDEIIISTLPEPISRWLRQDLPHRIEHKFGLPVTQVGVTKGAGS